MRAWIAGSFLAALTLSSIGCGGSSDDDARGGGSSGVAGSGGGSTGGTNSGGTNSGGTNSGGTNSGGTNSGGGGSGGQGGAAGAPGDPWASCPTSDDYTGDASWPHLLEVTGDAVYCATFDENRTLQQELAAKALLRVAPGSYPLPAEETPGIGLPVCVKLGEAAPAIAATGDGVRYTAFSFDDTTSHQYFFDQRMPEPERRLTLGLYVAGPSAQPPGFRLDGSSADPFDEAAPSGSFVLCQSLDEACNVDRVFDSCSHSSSTLNRHDVVLDTGPISLELRIGQSFAGTEPGAFVRASGSFRGQDFDQRNYFKLVYRPAHHHFERFFAVLFDEAIDGVCGVRIDALEPFEDLSPDQAFAVDCELNQLESLVVMSHTLTRE